MSDRVIIGKNGMPWEGNSDSEDEFYDAKGDLEVSGEIVIEELKDGEVPSASQIKKS
jgi:hypothetical protein